MLKQVSQACYDNVGKIYCDEVYRFPLIATVIAQDQKGYIYTISNNNKMALFLVVHKFGFGQLFGDSFEVLNDLVANLASIAEGINGLKKLRIYSPSFSHLIYDYGEKSIRCKFRLNDTEAKITTGWDASCFDQNLEIIDVNRHNCQAVDNSFGLNLFARFWNNQDEFLQNSMAKVVRKDGRYLSICYAAAVADNVAEIDIATIPEARKCGYAKVAARAFINECLSRGITPNWDCFTNNVGSVALAKSLGFEKYLREYDLFTINLNKMMRNDEKNTNCG